MANPPVLSVRDLAVELRTESGTRSILSDISFDLEPRQIMGIIGASGSGKTVLSRALVNWIDPPLAIASGSVIYKSQNILELPPGQLRPLRKEIAYVGANPMGALDPTLPVGAQIVEKIRAVVPGMDKAEAQRRVIELLGAVRIPSPAQRFHEYPSQFSGGMMQRALIVDALATNPAFLVADNVTQPLDVTVAAQVMRLMRELTERFDTAVVFVSSSLPTVSEAADQVLVLADGRIVERQTPAKLIREPQHPYTVQLISEIPQIWTAAAPVVESPERSGTPLISIEDATRTYRVRKRSSFAGYNNVRAVRNVTFDVYPGENFGIVGESGCGKSSLMRLLSRLESPDTGRVVCDGQDIAKLSGAELLKFRRDFQLVLQDPFNSLPPRTSIGAIIEGPLKVHGVNSAAKRRERALAVMHEVGLSAALYDELPLGLSAGQRQRVNVARAMVLEPKVLIMDETLSSLDQTEQFKLLKLFSQLQAKHGLTYIFISHDMAMVRRVCNRIAVMYLGEVVEIADNGKLFFDPGHPYTKALLSAIPTLEKRRYRPEDCLLEGEPPSPIDLPPGCSFASRCPKAFGRCHAESPVLTVDGKEGMAACFLLESAGGRIAA
ncbi:dipeptide ABC transporter ATP-binding protein [Chelatococcus reniformis]|uniref:Glutathione ABC transporter ATP-binding protein n=1 Tax=Chelatococcus reniformis TaxID=1494448 RepID=A0A916USN5_9HYPH|nr:ABC transporter ATP-binding protein [Chelatococcus reniformis]GGC85085.1 glutathione ABC transporter ATP-binding protein [Chelatococcus reniformis]